MKRLCILAFRIINIASGAAAALAVLAVAFSLWDLASMYTSAPIPIVSAEQVKPENEGRMVRVRGYVEMSEKDRCIGQLGAFKAIFIDERTLAVTAPPCSQKTLVVGWQEGDTLHVCRSFKTLPGWWLSTHENVAYDRNSGDAELVLRLMGLIIALIAMLLMVCGLCLSVVDKMQKGGEFVFSWARMRALVLAGLTLLPICYVIVPFLSLPGEPWVDESPASYVFFAVSVLPAAVGWLLKYRFRVTKP